MSDYSFAFPAFFLAQYAFILALCAFLAAALFGPFFGFNRTAFFAALFSAQIFFILSL